MTFGLEEKILRRETLHPGVFALPLLSAVVLLAGSVLLVDLVQPLIQLARGGAVVGVLTIAPEFLSALCLVGATMVAYLNSEVVLTKKTLRFRTGLLARIDGEVSLENVKGLFLFRSFLGRILGFGTITVMSPDGKEWRLPFIARPSVFLELIQSAVKAAKEAPPGEEKTGGLGLSPDVHPAADEEDSARLIVPILAFGFLLLLFGGAVACMLPMFRAAPEKMSRIPAPFSVDASHGTKLLAPSTEFEGCCRKPVFVPR